jgi:hypothetical protein
MDQDHLRGLGQGEAPQQGHDDIDGTTVMSTNTIAASTRNTSAAKTTTTITMSTNTNSATTGRCRTLHEKEDRQRQRTPPLQ